MRICTSTAVAAFTGALVGTAIFAVSGAAHAQTSDATTSPREAATINYDVPAGPLAGALNRVADTAGVTLAYSTSLSEGLRTNGISGRYTARDAFAVLLAGTGLTFRFTADNTVKIEKAPQGETRVLGPVRVEGADGSRINGVNGSRDVTATEGTGSFTSGALTVGSKTPKSIKDVPYSISVLTAERLEQQNISDFTEALAQAPGVTLVTGGTNGGGTSLETAFYSRGFQISGIQVDGGAPLLMTFGTPNRSVGFFPQIDMAQYDHVELLRGAAGLFNGYGDPSGTINLVRKKPLDHSQVRIAAEAGSWNHYRVELDATAPLAFDGRLRGRGVVSFQDNDHFYARARDNETSIYGVTEYDLTPAALLTAGVSYTRQDSVPWWGGVPRYENGDDLFLPRSTSFVLPWNRHDLDTTELFVTATRELPADWTAKINVTQNSQTSKRKLGGAAGAVNPQTLGGMTLVGRMDDYSSEQIMAEATLAGSLEILGQRQEALFGVNHSNTDGSGLRSYEHLVEGTAFHPYQPYQGGPIYCRGRQCPPGSIPEIKPPTGSPFAFDPFDLTYNEPRATPPANFWPKYGQIQTGVYANFNFTAFDSLHLATGLRWSRYKHKFYQEDYCTSVVGTCEAIGDIRFISSGNFSSDDFSWPPTASLSYDVTPDVTAHLLYADVYQSQGSLLTVKGDTVDPITGSNWEAGLKWAARGGRLNVALTGYRIQKEGYAQQDPSVPFSRVDGERVCCYFQRSDQTHESKGVDAEVAGEILPGLQVTAGYTFSRNEQKGTYFATNEGKPFVTRQPEHLLKLWTTYDFGASITSGSAWLSRLALSGGATWQSVAYFSGSTCTNVEQLFNADGTPQLNSLGNFLFRCTRDVPYDFTQGAYAVVGARANYRLNQRWSLALNVDNVTDKRYYQTITNVYSGNWYGAPRSVTVSLRGKW